MIIGLFNGFIVEDKIIITTSPFMYRFKGRTVQRVKDWLV